jgi:hypothetical protein
VSGKSFMQWYAEYILAYQARSCKPGATIPLAIMTSDDTHARTLAFLEVHRHFGLQPAQVSLVKQEKVPALVDNAAHFSMQPGSLLIETKPHGHGDVHHLLWSEGLATSWAKAGINYVAFFQVRSQTDERRGRGEQMSWPPGGRDGGLAGAMANAGARDLRARGHPAKCPARALPLTFAPPSPRPTPLRARRAQDTNALTFRAMACLLGVSVKSRLEYNSLTVPRTAGEAVGGIVRLTKPDGTSMTVNVEYNQLDPLLRATVSPAGDVADPASGCSPYPGNINVLALELRPYVKTLEETGGQMPEFVNPKYKDAGRDAFTKPTRIECMMQDYPKLLHAGARVGFTQLDRWLCFSPVKNHHADAAKKAAAGGPPESASTGEADMYAASARMLRAAGMHIEAGEPLAPLGIPVVLAPQLHLSPAFATTWGELLKKVKGGAISKRSSLVVNGEASLRGLELDGALVVHACNGASAKLEGLRVTNAGWQLQLLAADEAAAEEVAMRGYKLVQMHSRTLAFSDGKERLVKV